MGYKLFQAVHVFFHVFLNILLFPENENYNISFRSKKLKQKEQLLFRDKNKVEIKNILTQKNIGGGGAVAL